MAILKIKSLEKYQHYKDRDMIWFKWRVDALQDYSFSQLTDSQKWIFIGLISLACKCKNAVPYDTEWIRKQISNSKCIKKDIEALIASSLLAVCYQDASPIREEEIREEEIREEKKDSAEPQSVSTPPEAPPVMLFPVCGNGKEEWPLTQELVDQLQASYPAVQILEQCQSARAWCVTNPTRRKTARGMPAFLNRWLSKEQNRGGIVTPEQKRNDFRRKLEEQNANG